MSKGKKAKPMSVKKKKKAVKKPAVKSKDDKVVSLVGLFTIVRNIRNN